MGIRKDMNDNLWGTGGAPGPEKVPMVLYYAQKGRPFALKGQEEMGLERKREPREWGK